jgi:hypothetical protein
MEDGFLDFILFCRSGHDKRLHKLSIHYTLYDRHCRMWKGKEFAADLEPIKSRKNTAEFENAS